MSKFCPKCQITKDDTDFYRNKNRKGGLAGWCKLCAKAKAASYFQQLKKDPEKYASYLNDRNNWKKLHKGFDKEYRRIYRRSTWNGRAIRCNELFNQKKKKFLQNHQPITKILGLELQGLFLKFNQKCAYCAKELTIQTVQFDHRVAISQGGGNILENLLPSCFKCNNKKKNKYWEIGHNLVTTAL